MATDDNMKLGLDVEVETHGEESLVSLGRQLANLGRNINRINEAMGRVAKGLPTGSATSGSNPGRGSTSNTNTPRETRSASSVYGFDKAALAAFKQRMAMQGRLANQQAREERQSYSAFQARTAFKARADAADLRAIRDKANEEQRAFRQRMGFTSRMAKLAISEERNTARERSRSIAEAARQEDRRSQELVRSIRENARLESSEQRRVARERSARESSRSRNIDRVRSGSSEAREGASRVVRGAGATTAVATAATGSAIRRGISTRTEVDTAETNLKIFSGQTAEQIRAARKGFLDNEAIKNGLGIAGGLDAYSEVLKTGMKSPEANVKTIMQAVSALELDLKDTTKLAGLIDRNYGAASDPAKIKSALNAVAVAAREDPTQSGEVIEGVKRSFGALSTGNLTPEQLTAMVSGGQSVGIQPGKAGTFVATMAKQLSMGSSKFLGKKNRQELDFASRELGFGDARSMAQTYASDSYGTMMKVHEKLAGMEAAKRTQVAEALYGRQWSDEGLQMAQGVGGVRKTYGEITDTNNNNFLEEAARQRAESMQGQWNSTKSIFGRFWDAFGSGFEDILASINKYFFELNATFDYDKVRGYVSDFLSGAKEAFGVSTWKELFQSAFGGNIGNAGQEIKAFGRGITEGILSIARGFQSALSLFSGGDMSAETIGKLSGQFIALSIGLVALAPVLSIMGGLVSLVTGLAIAGRGLAGLAGLGAGAATAGAAGMGATMMRGLGLALSRMFVLVTVAEIGANRAAISAWMLKAGESLVESIIAGIKSAFTKDAILGAMRAIVDQAIPSPLKRWLDADGKLQEKNGLGSKTLEGIGKPPVTTQPQSPTTPTPTPPAAPSLLGRTWDWLMSSLIGSANANEVIPPPPRPGMPGAPGVPGLPGQPGLSTFVAIETRPVSPVSPIRVPTIARPTTSDFTTPAPLGSVIGTETGQQPPLGLPGLPGQPGAPGVVSIIEVAPRPIAFAAPVMTPAIRQSTTPATTEIAANENANLIDAIRENTKALRANLEPKVSKLSDFVSRTTTNNYAVSDSVRSAAIDPAARVQQAALPFSSGTGGGGFGPSPLSGSIPGSAMAPGGGRLSSRGIIGGAGSVPGAGPGMGPMPGGVGGGFGGAPAGAVSGRMKSVYDGFRAAGLSHEAAKSFTAEIGRENDYNPNVMFGSHIDPHNKKRNAGMMSWQGDRAENLMARLREGGHVNPDGSIKRTQEAVNAQATFAVDEMKNGALGARGQRALGVLNNPNATHADRALALGDDVIKWRQHDPRYASHAQKRDGYYSQMEGVSKGVTGRVAGLGNVPSGGSGSAVDVAGKYLGMNERNNRRELSGFVGHDIAGSANAWCSRFVNASLKAVGQSGTGSAVANSFLKWGEGVNAEYAQKGDVLVEHRNKGANNPGGHVGFATGEKRVNPKTGEFELEMLSGNSSDAVQKTWERASKLAVRRGNDPGSQLAGQIAGQTAGLRAGAGSTQSLGEGIRSSGFRPGMGGNSPVSASVAPEALGTNTPIRVQNTQQIGGSTPPGAGGGSSVNAPITINGAGMDAEAIANAVERKLQSSMSRRTHDTSPHSLSV